MQSTELVTLQGDVPMTTSRIVAEVFEKRHDHVMDDIEALIADMRRRLDAQDETKSSTCKNPDEHFIPTLTEVTIGSGARREAKGYNLTQIGFTLLAFGFQGEKALDFKCQFIDAFVDLTHQNLQLLKQNEVLQKRLMKKLEKENQLLLTDNTTISAENKKLVAEVKEEKRMVSALNSVVADFTCAPSKVKERIDVGVCRERSKYRAEIKKIAKVKGDALLAAHALLVDRLRRKDQSLISDGYISEPLSDLKMCARALTYLSDSAWEEMDREAVKAVKVQREVEDADAEYGG